jgi:kinesin family member 11
MPVEQNSTKLPIGQPRGETECNIKVVIRCRGRSKKEKQENSPSIVTCNTIENEISVETAALTSILGIVALPPTRTYPYDHVFGPEVDQSSIYQAVVLPMLNEVLQGYNCTMFAYGQTGTGKT